MKPYRLKHKPTGLYFQPCKHRGSHLSKNGKIYQTASHGLSAAINWSNRYPKDNNSHTFIIHCQYDSVVYKQTKDIILWLNKDHRIMTAYTRLSDWVKEDI